MRGEKNLFSPYFQKVKEDSEKKGRSESLIAQRDKKMIARYYYHTYFKKLKFQDTINQLIIEFDIAERTITDRLQLKNEMISELIKLKPDTTKLKRDFPFFSW